MIFTHISAIIDDIIEVMLTNLSAILPQWYTNAGQVSSTPSNIERKERNSNGNGNKKGKGNENENENENRDGDRDGNENAIGIKTYC